MMDAGADGAPLIDLAGVTKVFGIGDIAVHALQGIDLQIRRGEFVAIMGPSGSGKSTLLAALARETAMRGEGLLMLDPHGTTVDRILRELPESERHRVLVIRCEPGGSDSGRCSSADSSRLGLRCSTTLVRTSFFRRCIPIRW